MACPWPWPWPAQVLGRLKSLALALALGLALSGQVLGLGLGLEGQVLGLGLRLCVLDSNTGQCRPAAFLPDVCFLESCHTGPCVYDGDGLLNKRAKQSQL